MLELAEVAMRRWRGAHPPRREIAWSSRIQQQSSRICAVRTLALAHGAVVRVVGRVAEALARLVRSVVGQRRGARRTSLAEIARLALALPAVVREVVGGAPRLAPARGGRGGVMNEVV